MTDFIVTIIDPDQLAGITWARELRNASLPPVNLPPEPLPGDGDYIDNTLPSEPLSADQVPLETDEEYVQWVMEQAAISYALQQEQATWRQAYENAQAESMRKREAARAKTAVPADREEGEDEPKNH